MPAPTKILGLPGTAITERALAPGYVSTARPAPTSFTEPVWVILPEHSTEAPIPCAWGAEHGTTLPAQGDRVIVGFPGGENDVPVILWWEGVQGGIERGAVLPGSPFDGQEYDYVADAANVVIWRFRYRGASASAHKWEFVGGSDLAAVNGEIHPVKLVSTSFVWQEIAKTPKLVAPLNGEYMVMAAAENIQLQSAPPGAVQLDIGIGASPAAIYAGAASVVDFQFAALPVTMMRQGSTVGLASGNVLGFYAAGSNTLEWNVSLLELHLRPVRVG
jgi:hypothetical protein